MSFVGHEYPKEREVGGVEDGEGAMDGYGNVETDENDVD